MEQAPERSGLYVLAQTDDWAVVAKPSGMLVHHNERSREHGERGPVALQAARDLLGRHVHPVHRLDRPTSGCLLFAFSPEGVAALSDALREGDKQYVALVRGHIASDDPVTVDNPMKDSRGRVKEARTWFRRVAGSDDPRCSLVLARPQTGRFHQVRRHIRDLSHPVIGDTTHGDSKVNRWWREAYGLHRLALHCLSLDLPLPTGRLQVSCPVPDDLGATLRRMPWWEDAVTALPTLDEAPPTRACA